MPQRSPLIDESRQAPAPKPARPPPWKSVFVYHERFIQNAPKWSEGAVSQAAADPISTHMWTRSVGLCMVGQQSAAKGSSSPTARSQPVRVHAEEQQGCLTFHLLGGCS